MFVRRKIDFVPCHIIYTEIDSPARALFFAQKKAPIILISSEIAERGRDVVLSLIRHELLHITLLPGSYEREIQLRNSVSFVLSRRLSPVGKAAEDAPLISNLAEDIVLECTAGTRPVTESVRRFWEGELKKGTALLNDIDLEKCSVTASLFALLLYCKAVSVLGEHSTTGKLRKRAHEYIQMLNSSLPECSAGNCSVQDVLFSQAVALVMTVSEDVKGQTERNSRLEEEIAKLARRITTFSESPIHPLSEDKKKRERSPESEIPLSLNSGGLPATFH